MLNKEKVLEISRVSKAERWPYPKTFEALKEAGVEYYDVDVATHRITYHGKGQSFDEGAPAGHPTLQVSHHFDKSGIESSIRHHQVAKTAYADFLREIAKAGVKFYRVDMAKRTVSYCGSSPGEEHVEKVPQGK